MPYEFNKTYEFIVRGLGLDANSGKEYFETFDEADGSHLHRIYNVFKGQLTDLPPKVRVVLSKHDQFDRFFFRQDEVSVLKNHYNEGDTYEFHISDKKKDFNSNVEYLVVEDEFSEQRLYLNGQLGSAINAEVGGVIVLTVNGVKERGFGHGFLDLAVPGQGRKKNITVRATEEPLVSTEAPARSNREFPVFDGPEEGTTVEYKTSIAFPPQKEADIDSQLYTIVKTLAAFMNSDGGTMYIGIHDKTKEIQGILDDFQYLNSGEDDFNGTYSKNTDGYQLKIRNTIDRWCNGLANSLLEFDFKTEGGQTYCIIKVDASTRPIWVHGNQLWQRIGNRNKQLKGEEITLFVYDKSTVSISNYLDLDDLKDIQFSQERLIAAVHNAFQSEIMERREKLAASVRMPDSGSIKYYFVWFDDGKWKWQRDKSEEPGVAFQVPVVDDNARVVFCYASGTVNEVKVRDFKKNGARRSARINEIRNKGFSEQEKPASIFIASPGDLIVVYATDSHGSEHVKVHRVQDFNPTERAFNQGPRIIPRDGRVLAFKWLPSSEESRVSHLIVPQNQTTLSFGTVITSPIYQTEIEYALGK